MDRLREKSLAQTDDFVQWPEATELVATHTTTVSGRLPSRRDAAATSRSSMTWVPW